MPPHIRLHSSAEPCSGGEALSPSHDWSCGTGHFHGETFAGINESILETHEGKHDYLLRHHARTLRRLHNSVFWIRSLSLGDRRIEPAIASRFDVWVQRGRSSYRSAPSQWVSGRASHARCDIREFRLNIGTQHFFLCDLPWCMAWTNPLLIVCRVNRRGRVAGGTGRVRRGGGPHGSRERFRPHR